MGFSYKYNSTSRNGYRSVGRRCSSRPKKKASLIKVLVTRELAVDSPLKELRNSGFEITGFPFISFAKVDQAELPRTDWIFFSSPQSAKSLLPEHDLSSYAIASLGIGTAKVLQNFGYESEFIGKGTPAEAVNQFLSQHPRGSVFIPHSDISVGTVTSIIPKERYVSKVTYRTLKLRHKLAYSFDIVVFTSPSNVEAYLTENALENIQVIAIGRTTENALKMNGYTNPIYVPDEPTEEAMSRLIKKKYNRKRVV